MLFFKTIAQLQAHLLAKETTCLAIVKQHLALIHEQNSNLNVFLEVYEAEAIALAQNQDSKIAKGEAILPLTGVVIGIKDLLCYQNHESNGGSKILKGFKSLFSATAVQRLVDAGAIIIGRQNCDEFGMGSNNLNSAFGPVKNAANLEHVAGGSSGGSAVAVQAGMCQVSIGTDTGGSVRQPAGYCGVVGLKPTYSRVSRWGLKAYASSFDTIGPITNSVEDAALVLKIMAGYDENDATSSSKTVPESYIANTKISKIAVYKEVILGEGINKEVYEATMAKIESLKELGHTVEVVDFPLMKHFLPTYYILTTAEASSNLSRYDGVRYGYRSANATDILSNYKLSRAEGFGAEVKKRIMLGTFVLSASYYDAYYTKAQKVRRLIKEETDKILNEFDFIVYPIAPTVAPKINTNKEQANPLEEFLADVFTVQANVVGNPAICIPNGANANNMPIGFQIMGKNFEEQALLSFAKSIL